ncbi:MAG: DinB family protein [Bryobacteraceae bacterium]
MSTILYGVSDDALERRPVAGKWSARENIAHLARYHEIFLQRIERIRTEDNPRLERYRAEEDSEWAQWACKPAGEVLKALQALRLETVGVVEKLSDPELTRTAIHSRFGAMTLVQWLEFFLLHEAHHLFVAMQRARE